MSPLLTRRQALWLGLAVITAKSFGTKPFKAVRAAQFSNQAERSFTVDEISSLRLRAKSKGLLFGAASGRDILISDPEFADNFTDECDIIVPENDLKWTTIRPGPNEFDFTQGDWLIDFAQSHNLLCRGHTLVWHWVPSWFEEIVNSQNAEDFLVNHIKTVVQRYAGQMHSWDVVNEAVEPKDGQPQHLRNSPWFKLLGENYIEIAFKVAAEADPLALLVYNDYGIEYDTPENETRRVAVLDLLERLLSRGTPIHALGVQSHLFGHETRFSPQKLRQFLADIASLGLKILVTELDVADTQLPADSDFRDRIVAAAYEDYLNVVLDEPAVIAVLTWGLSDRYTWLSQFAPRSDGLPVRPLPLDEHMNRKLAWNAIARALDQAPRRK